MITGKNELRINKTDLWKILHVGGGKNCMCEPLDRLRNLCIGDLGIADDECGRCLWSRFAVIIRKARDAHAAVLCLPHDLRRRSLCADAQ